MHKYSHTRIQTGTDLELELVRVQEPVHADHLWQGDLHAQLHAAPEHARDAARLELPVPRLLRLLGGSAQGHLELTHSPAIPWLDAIGVPELPHRRLAAANCVPALTELLNQKGLHARSVCLRGCARLKYIRIHYKIYIVYTLSILQNTCIRTEY